MHVSKIIEFQVQVPYHTLTSVGEMRQAKVVEGCACERSHRTSGPSPLPHTDEYGGDTPVKGGDSVNGVHVSATIAFQAQVHYHTLTSMVEMPQSKMVEECACECNHCISGPSPSSHTGE